jgi:ribosomal protein S6--L-glutamate ligase
MNSYNMILSFHPCIEGDRNIICAGREPGPEDLAAIKSADAVILPQGCYPELYDMAQTHCENVFPNFDARFQYPGKIGQIKLFRKFNIKHPKTLIFQDVASMYDRYDPEDTNKPFDYPFVFKFDWGGEGDTVFFIESNKTFFETLEKAKRFEHTGQKGFLIQEYIPSDNRSLRVIVIGDRLISYWRVQIKNDAFYTGLGKGAQIDADMDPELQEMAADYVKDFSRKAGINLAGYDVLFSSERNVKVPILLEINYFFGRRGLGGSEAFYRILESEVCLWLKNLGLDFKKELISR